MLNFNYIRNLQQAFHKWLQFKWNGTLKDMMGFEKFSWIWKYCLTKQRKSKKERNKKYKKTNNDGLLRNHKIVQLEPQNQRVESCPPEESGVLAPFDISY